MKRCCVPGCDNRWEPHNALRFFSTPEEPKARQRWATALGLKSLPNICFVCHEHFGEDSWSMRDRMLNIPKHKRQLVSNAIPSLKLPTTPTTKKNKRQERQMEKERKAMVAAALEEYENTQKKQKPDKVSIQYIVSEKQLEEYERVIEFQKRKSSEMSISYIEPEEDSHKQEFKLDFELEEEPIPEEMLEVLPEGEEEEEEHQSDPQVVQLPEVYITYSNAVTQTESKSDSGLEKEIHRLKVELQRERKLRAQQNVKLQEMEALRQHLSVIFTPMQLKQLSHPRRKINWSMKDISNSLALYKAIGMGPYQILCDRKYPLPAPKTLQKWALLFNSNL